MKEGFEEKTSPSTRYVVINTYDREIMKVGVSKTPSEATEIMKTDFMRVFLEYYEEEDFENEVGCGDEWEFNQTEAWLNTQGIVDYDWRIIEVSDDDLL